jgi:hypothetical protein
MKKQKPELVNLAELARRAHVSPGAVQQFLRKQKTLGSPIPTTTGAHRREKLIDPSHPAIQGYLQNETHQPVNRVGAKPVAGAALEKLKAMTEKKELSAATLREKHIDREFVLQYLDEFLKTEKGELETMVNRVITGLTKQFGPVSRAKLKEVRRILAQPCRDALEMTSHEIEKFKRDTQPRTSTRPVVPASKGKPRGKKSNPLPR